jgi:hypothetical protein
MQEAQVTEALKLTRCNGRAATRFYFAQRARKQIGRAAGRTGSRDAGFQRGSTEAVDDFSKATNIARNMVTRFGMHEKLGLVTYRRRGRLSSARMRLAHFAERECNSNPAGASIYLGWLTQTSIDPALVRTVLPTIVNSSASRCWRVSCCPCGCETTSA